MKILILTCNTGEGHNSTSRAIKEEAERRLDTVDVWDALSFWPVGTNSFICNGQEFLYKYLPELFGQGYRFAETVSEMENKRREQGKKIGQGLYPFAKIPSEKMCAKILEEGFDVVLCAHIFASLMITEFKKHNSGYSIPTYLIATDYTCSPGANFSEIDGCFTPAEALEDEFVSLGVRKELIIPVGIPVREDFYEKKSKSEAKELLGLPSDRRIVLLMSGSMGCGPIAKTVETIINTLPDDCMLVAVCGRNERLLAQLTELSRSRRNLAPVGFTKEIPLYMDAAELVVTKAGGLSSTEAGVKNLPVVFIDAIPGLEVHNRDFFVNHGYGRYGNSPEEISSHIVDLLSSPEALEGMRKKMQRDFFHHSAREILDKVHGHEGPDA